MNGVAAHLNDLIAVQSYKNRRVIQLDETQNKICLAGTEKRMRNENKAHVPDMGANE